MSDSTSIDSKPNGTAGNGKPPAKPDSGTTESAKGISDTITDANNYELFDPEFVRVDPDRVTKRKPGRPRGSGGKRDNGSSNTGEAEKKNSLVDPTTLLLSIHQMLAALLDIQEIELEKGEAKAIADAGRDLASHYAVIIDPKKLSIANLLIVLIGIYGTRAMAYRQRRKVEAAANPAKEKVTPMPSGKARAAAAGQAGPGQPATPHELWPEAPAEGANAG